MRVLTKDICKMRENIFDDGTMVLFSQSQLLGLFDEIRTFFSLFLTIFKIVTFKYLSIHVVVFVPCDNIRLRKEKPC